jgi:hypothetical protein
MFSPENSDFHDKRAGAMLLDAVRGIGAGVGDGFVWIMDATGNIINILTPNGDDLNDGDVDKKPLG